MKIISILTFDASQPPDPPDEEHMAAMGAFITEMKSQGVLIDTGGAMDGMLELKIFKPNGKTVVTDGPFTESKEIVGGYALFAVKDREEAIHWTNRFLDLVPNATCHLHEVSSPP